MQKKLHRMSCWNRSLRSESITFGSNPCNEDPAVVCFWLTMVSPLANPANARQTGATLTDRFLVFSSAVNTPGGLCGSFDFMLPNEDITETPPEKAHWFTTTHWSVVLEARGKESPGAEAALERLCKTYWYPLYAFVRREGYDEESAKDFTQGFFEQPG